MLLTFFVIFISDEGFEGTLTKASLLIWAVLAYPSIKSILGSILVVATNLKLKQEILTRTHGATFPVGQTCSPINLVLLTSYLSNANLQCNKKMRRKRP